MEWTREEFAAAVTEHGRRMFRAARAVLDSDSFGHRRLLKAFPRLRSIDHGGALERLRRRAGNLRNH